MCIWKYLLIVQAGNQKLTHYFVLVYWQAQNDNLGSRLQPSVPFELRYQNPRLTLEKVQRMAGGLHQNQQWALLILRSTLKEYSVCFIQCEIGTESGDKPKPGVLCMVTVNNNEWPLITGGPTSLVLNETNRKCHSIASWPRQEQGPWLYQKSGGQLASRNRNKVHLLDRLEQGAVETYLPATHT